MKISEWRKSLDIIAKHSPKGENEDFIFEAEHDIIYSHLMAEDIPEDSKEGKLLIKFGWRISDADVWAITT